MTWILLRSGHPFDLQNPTPDMIRPVDIAYALARICRFNGHTREHYSVAQHSLHVAELVPPEHQLVALLHDAAEAYIGDVSSPLKALLPEYRAIEARIWTAICKRFGIPEELPDCVKQADLVMLATERRDVMPHNSTPWACLDGIEARPGTIIPMDPVTARSAFHQRLNQLLDAAAATAAAGVTEQPAEYNVSPPSPPAKPCPFCGGDRSRNSESVWIWREHLGRHVDHYECKDCGATAPKDVWERRNQPPSSAELIIGDTETALDVRLGLRLQGENEVATVTINQHGKRVVINCSCGARAARIADALLGFQPYAVAVSAAAAGVQGEPAAHEWDGAGERCMACGDKDWFASPSCESKQKAEQHPAPDVSGLVEALEQCVTSMIDSGYRADAVVIQASRAALAVYRKGGDQA